MVTRHADQALLITHDLKFVNLDVMALMRRGASFEFEKADAVVTITVQQPGRQMTYIFSEQPDMLGGNYRMDEGLVRLVRLAFGPSAPLMLPDAARSNLVLLVPHHGAGGLLIDPRETFMHGGSATFLHRPRTSEATVTLYGGGGERLEILNFKSADAYHQGLPPCMDGPAFLYDDGAKLLLHRLAALNARDLS